MWRNERILYKRKCDLCGEDTIGIYHSENYHTIYCQKCWWSDEWNPMSYGRDYDFTKPFFEQFKELMMTVPRMAIHQDGTFVNSPYTNYGMEIKNCYLSYSTGYSENVNYSNQTFYSNDSFDCLDDHELELCYECNGCRKNYKVDYSVASDNCTNSSFVINSRNCFDCFGCINKRNKKYFFLNEFLSENEYNQRIDSIKGSYEKYVELKKQFATLILKNISPAAFNKNTQNSTGNFLENCNNICNGFSSKRCEDSRDIFITHDTKDSHGTCYLMKSNNCYDLIAGIGIANGKFSCYGRNSDFCRYCELYFTSFHLFACVGLRNKQYCILNKQYTKEQYEELAPKIIKHMNEMPYIDKKGRIYKYGEFFPPELSPFAYNETVAQEYFPLTKEQAINKGYQWKDPETKNYQITLKTEQIPDHIKDVKDDMLNQVIQCKHYGIDSKQTLCNEQCSMAFKIIPRELEFYRKNNLPLPRLCPNCRHYQRIKQRNPLKLWHRQCMCAGTQSDNKVYRNTINHNHHNDNHCPNEFETTYAPERKEIVYCEKCYQEEVA